jgi:hypothetical protein
VIHEHVVVAADHKRESVKMRIAVFSLLVFAILTASAAGQQVPRFEIGPTVSRVTVNELSGRNNSGFGGRLVVNFADILAADLQAARISKTRTFFPGFPGHRSQETHDQFTANLKATWRLQNAIRINPFALAGTGWVRDGYNDSFSAPGGYEFHQDRFVLRFCGC